MYTKMSNGRDLFQAMPDDARFLPTTIDYDEAKRILTMELWRWLPFGRKRPTWIPGIWRTVTYYARARLIVRHISDAKIDIREPEYWCMLEQWIYDEATGIFKFDIFGHTDILLKINRVEVELIDTGDFSEDPMQWTEQHAQNSS